MTTSRPLRVRLIAGLTALAGAITMLSTLSPFGRRFERVSEALSPFDLPVTAHLLGLVSGFGLLYLAGNLAQRKRVAWLLATGLFSLAAAAPLLRWLEAGRVAPLGRADVVVNTAMVVLLVWARRDFRAESDPPTFFAVLKFVPLYLAVVYTYGLLALWLERDHLSPEPTLGRDLVTVTLELIGLDGVYQYQQRLFGLLFPWSLTVLGIVGLLVALVLVLRPIVGAPRTDDDRQRAEALVRRWGDDTLAFFALRHDKSYFFSSDGEAMIAYAYLGRHALASGDPIGAPGSIDLVVDEFLAMCARHGWGVAFLAVREADADRYRDRGLRTFYLGDEAVIDTTRFTLDGKRNKSMRQSVGRVARTYTFELVREVDTTPELRSQLNAISVRWRGKAPERGFTMSLSQDVTGADPDYLLAVARRTDDGVAGGFLRLVPVVGDHPGATLDLMRRDPDTPNGMTEYLVANTVAALRERGLERLSLNFAVMGRLFSPDVHFSPGQRLLRWVVSALNPFFQIKSLHDFNRRFRPDWVPRVIVYEDQRSLPQVSLLYSGVEGFLALPLVGRYFVPTRHSEPPG